MGEVEYLFKHALIQQTAYETIPSSQRNSMHLKVARAIEKAFAERIQDFFGILAYHYSHTEEHEKAETYLIQAGEKDDYDYARLAHYTHRSFFLNTGNSIMPW